MITNQGMSLNYKVCQVEGNIVSDMGGEKVMLSIKNGKYYNLGEIGGEIWDLINNPIEISRIINTLISRYHVDIEECEEQVIDFIHLLSNQGLVEIVK